MVTKRWVWVVAGMLGCLGFGAATARGEFMTFAFEGVVDEVVDWSYVITQYVQIGDTLSGTVTIDRSVADSATQSDLLGEYAGAVVAVEGQVGQMSFSLDTRTTSTIQIVNDAPPRDSDYPGPWDRYKQGAYVQTPVVDYVLSFGMTLMDFSGQAFPSAMGDALPDVMPPASAFQDRPGNDNHFVLGGGAYIAGDLTFIETVPEPATLSMLLLGGGITVARRQRRAR